jgi:hypothetical protein
MTNMSRTTVAKWAWAGILTPSLVVGVFSVRGVDGAEKLAPLPIELPAPWHNGPESPPLPPVSLHIEPLPEKHRPPFLAPVGVTNAALRKPVTMSVHDALFSRPSAVTDGSKEVDDDAQLQMPKGIQWVQIDFQQTYRIYAILIWHVYHRNYMIVHGVVVQVADDPEFSRNVRTLFNNDYENKIGFGVGTDKDYVETN